MPKLTLTNGLWIGIAPKMLPKLTMVEETLITRYHCRTTLSNLVIVHFVGSTHPEVVKSCKFLYVCKYVVTLWLTWLKFNHIEYRCTTINMHKLNMLPDDNIPNPLMRSIFKSTNIKLANDEQCTNITDLHK